MDVKTAFLHGDLDKEIYMAQPEGFEARQGTFGVQLTQESLWIKAGTHTMVS